MPRKKKHDQSAFIVLALGIFLILFSLSFFRNCSSSLYADTKTAHITGYSCTIFLSDIFILIFIGIVLMVFSMGMQTRKGYNRK